MGDHNIGKVFVEVDLDYTPYNRSSKRLYQDATRVSTNIEKNFHNLGIRSAKEFDLMRAKVVNSYNIIAKSSKATAQDILRAERAKNEQLARLNEQQYGAQVSMLGRLKQHWRSYSVVAVAALYAIQRAGRAQREEFKGYETALIDMQKVTDRSLSLIEEDIEKIPRVLGDATALMRGYYQTISAGVKDPVAALNLLTTAAQTAKAAHVDQSETIKALTKMMAGFRGEIDKTSVAADLLFSIEKEGQTTVQELVPIIGDVASASNLAGVSHYEMAAALARITQTAGSTSEAATQYRGILMALIKPNEKLTSVIDGLGYSSAKAMVDELGFADSLRAVTEKAEDLNIPFGKLFRNQEAILGITALSSREYSTYRETLELVSNQVGVADEKYAEWLGTTEAVDAELESNFKRLLKEIGKTHAPLVNKVLGKTSEIFGDLADNIKRMRDNGLEDMTQSLAMFGLLNGTISDTDLRAYREAVEGIRSDWEATKDFWQIQAEDRAKADKEALEETTTETRKAWGENVEIVKNAGKSILEANRTTTSGVVRQLETVSGVLESIGEQMQDTGYMGAQSWEQWDEMMYGTAEETIEEVKDELSGLESFWKHTIDNMHDATANFFYDILDTAKISFDGIKDWFKQLLAQMLALAASNTIVIPIMTAVGGSLGLTGTATASTGGLDISSLTGLSRFASFGSGSSWSIFNPTSILEASRGTASTLNLSSILGYAGIGISAFQAIKAFSEGNYGTGAGTVLGGGIGAVFGGPVGAAIGAGLGNLVGGIVDSIFGGSNAGFGSFSHTVTNTGAWGGLPDLGTFFEASRGSGSASQELIDTVNEGIAASLNTVYDAVDSFASLLPDDIGQAFMDALEGSEIQYLPKLEGLISDYTGEWHMALTRETADMLEEWIASIPEHLLEQVTPLMDTAIKTWVGSMDLSIIAEDSPLMDAWDLLMEGIDSFGGDIEAYAAAANLFAEALQDIEDALAAARQEAIEFHDSLTRRIGVVRFGTSYGYATDLEDTLQQIAGLENIPEDYRQHLINQALEYYNLQMDALNAGQDTAEASKSSAETQLETLQTLEKTIKTWKSVYDSVSAQLLGYQTTTANPQDAVERLAIARQAILNVTGGRSAMGYISSLGSAEEQASAIAILQDLYDNYLTVAQEAYQRPSTAYQNIFNEVTGELTSIMGYMESYAQSEWQIQIDQLDVLTSIEQEIIRLQTIVSGESTTGGSTGFTSSIPDWLKGNYATIYSSFMDALNAGPDTYTDWEGTGATVQLFEDQLMKFVTSEGKTHWYNPESSLFDMFFSNPDIAQVWAEKWGAGSYASGGVVPRDGLAYVHKGEVVRNYDSPELRNNITFNLNVSGDKPKENAKEVRTQLESFVNSELFRKAVQGASRGR